MANTARFAVGIDLGTTHTVVAYATLEGDDPVRVFPIPQWTSRTEWQGLPLLASALYWPMAGELPDERRHDDRWIAGDYARRRAVETEGRVVLSAKSWLSYAGVDRTAPILPWGAPPLGEEPLGAAEQTDRAWQRISPVDASARLLGHVRARWNEAHADAPLEEQRIVLTVPASFDETARELTVRAAEAAGLSVRLLEEPQAAFYAWLDTQTDQALAALLASHGGRLDAVVCDVGGGTTDLSLLRLAQGGGAAPSIERVAVGRHLLLGGDNMDLALAHACEVSMKHGEEDARLDPHRFGQLVLACRAAKERLLGANAPEEVAVVIGKKGASLVGSTLRATLTQGDVERLVVASFFPQAARHDPAQERPRSGFVAFGLPYEREVAITRHLARFCERHLGEHPGPAALLFNGGVFLSPVLTARVLEVVQAWNQGPVLRLSNDNPEVAVALGAVSFARTTVGRGRRIRGGLGRGYYVAVQGSHPARSLVCVVPRGTEAGEVQVAATTPVALLVGRPARFELFASERRSGDGAGDVVRYDEEQFEAMPPLVVRFGDARGDRPTETHVLLEGELSEVGTLNLSCVALEPDGAGQRARYALTFQIRPSDPPPAASPEAARSKSEAPRTMPVAQRASPKRLEDAARSIERVFGKGKAEASPREVKDLQRELERILGDRSVWSTSVNRVLFDELWKVHRGRRRTADHERVFWQLAGFCLRPGFGDPEDSNRAAGLSALFADKLAFGDESRSWQAFWIAWRRVAAGLDSAAQNALRDATDPFFAPSELRKKKPKTIRPDALDEMLEMASSLERVSPLRRAELGDWIVERTFTRRDARLWAAIGRLGARTPAYASAHQVVDPVVAERWLDHLLREKWEDLPGTAEAAVELTRRTGDRARDVRDSIRREVEQKLRRIGGREEWIARVREVVPVAEQDRAAFYGEGLPVGLRLVDHDPGDGASLLIPAPPRP
jgi:hypothetical protein